MSKGCKVKVHQTLRMIQSSRTQKSVTHLWFDSGRAVKLFLKSSIMTAHNFAALWPQSFTVPVMKYLDPVDIVFTQDNGSISKIGFAPSNWPHIHIAYGIGVCIFFAIAVDISIQKVSDSYFDFQINISFINL